MKRGRQVARALATFLLFAAVVIPASAQDAPPLPMDNPAAIQTEPLPLAPILPTPIDPAALLKGGLPEGGQADIPGPAAAGGFALHARLTEAGEAIPSGVIWRVFSAKRGIDGRLPLLRQQSGGDVRLPLPPGNYVVHAAYGRATAIKRIDVTGASGEETFVLNAGALKLSAVVGRDQPLPAGQVEFDVYPATDDTDPESNPIATDLPPDQMIRLNAGIYHVVSRYGDTNASVRADIRVEAGKLTEATLFQNAARITLKLVSEAGGEALANTSWSVLTAGGDSVFDSVGAFPEVVLAIGEYTAVAKHDDQIHERNFTVESGRNREVEVLAK